jgi:hypothetical protein
MMMNKIKFIYLLFFPLLFSLGSCEHDTDTFDGPFLVDRFGEFVLIDSLDVSQLEVNFSEGQSVFFTAQFNKRVDWTVRITGLTSGAVKLIEGFDNSLNAKNATWKGGTTELPFFKEEQCLVELLIPEAETLLLTKEVTVTGTKAYDAMVYADFEEDAGNDLELGNFEFDFAIPPTGRLDDTPAQGDWYYFMEGTDNTLDNFFVGLITIKSTITGETYAPFPTFIPEDLYFNAFIYSDGAKHTIPVVGFIIDSNDSGAFEDGTDEIITAEIVNPINWTGWRQFSFPMSDLEIPEEKLRKMVAMRVILISNNGSQPTPRLPVSFGIDYISFTNGGPLEL